MLGYLVRAWVPVSQVLVQKDHELHG